MIPGVNHSQKPGWASLFGGLLTLCLVLLLVLGGGEGAGLQELVGDLIPLPAEAQPGLRLHMLDVGQAQAILLTCDGNAALVDTGLKETGDEVVSYLRKQGVRSLEYLFITHPHSDHCGGARRVVQGIDTELLLYPDFYVKEAALATAGDWVGDSDTALAAAYAGQQYSLGSAQITVLHPARDNEIEDLNLLSLTLLVEYQGKRLLLTGDLTAEGEAELLPLEPVDVLQVAHHGSEYSSSEVFLEAVSPEIALISCGRGNDYGHPHKAVLERLEQAGASVYRTDRDGRVVVCVREGQITVEIENKE